MSHQPRRRPAVPRPRRTPARTWKHIEQLGSNAVANGAQTGVGWPVEVRLGTWLGNVWKRADKLTP
ncbi:hypothetical protein Q6283_29095, partial [Klebsiella pneumoniae]|nr:hypothetical protein [Klebsiella pneumoniae]